MAKGKEPETETMGSGQTEQATKDQELLDVEQLRSKKKISPAVFAGVCAANGWKPGRMVAEAEFLRAVQKFIKEPMQGTKATSEVKK